MKFVSVIILSLIVVGTGVYTADARAASPPQIATFFAADAVVEDGKVGVLYSISNAEGNGALSAVAFADSLPSGLEIANVPDISTNCDGTILAIPGASVISLSGATLGDGAICSIGVDLRATSSGTKTNIAGPVSSTESGVGVPSTAVNVDVVVRPTYTVDFGSQTAEVNADNTVIVNIENSNTSYDLLAVGFTDSLPSGLVNANPTGISGGCGAGSEIRAAPGTGTIELVGGSIVGGGSCAFTVHVRATTPGVKVNTPGDLSANFDDGGGDLATITGTSGTSTFNAIALAPATVTLSVARSSLQLRHTTRMRVHIRNPSATQALTAIAVSVSLTPGLRVAVRPRIYSSCTGRTLVGTRGGKIRLTGGVIEPGNTCGFAVTLVGRKVGRQAVAITLATSRQSGASALPPPVKVRVVADNPKALAMQQKWHPPAAE